MSEGGRKERREGRRERERERERGRGEREAERKGERGRELTMKDTCHDNTWIKRSRVESKSPGLRKGVRE